MKYSDKQNNKEASFAGLASSSRSTDDRQLEDYYATPPKAVEALLKRESFTQHIVEPAVGGGAYRS